MKSLDDLESWEVVSKKVYWDRDVSLNKWIEMIAIGHPSYLPDAINVMQAAEFLKFYGVRKFTHDWPFLKSQIKTKKGKFGMYDLAWSQLSGGGYNLKPYPEFNDMPEDKKQFLIAVAKTPGKCIEQIAETLNIQCWQATQLADNLISDGKIKRVHQIDDGQVVIKLYPCGQI